MAPKDKFHDEHHVIESSSATSHHVVVDEKAIRKYSKWFLIQMFAQLLYLEARALESWVGYILDLN